MLSKPFYAAAGGAASNQFNSIQFNSNRLDAALMRRSSVAVLWRMFLLILQNAGIVSSFSPAARGGMRGHALMAAGGGGGGGGGGSGGGSGGGNGEARLQKVLAQ